MASQNYLQKEQPVLLQLQKTLHNQQAPFLNGDGEVVDLISALSSFSADLVERGLKISRHRHSKCITRRYQLPFRTPFLMGERSHFSFYCTNIKGCRKHHQIPEITCFFKLFD